jgi:hypothetical protein
VTTRILLLRPSTLEFVCSDMWQPYLSVVARAVGHACHVLDRFHITQRQPLRLLERFLSPPKPSRGQPNFSEPQDQRLPSEARMSPYRSPRLIAGAPVPTGNLNLPQSEEPLSRLVIRPVRPTASTMIATPTILLLNRVKAMDLG